MNKKTIQNFIWIALLLFGTILILTRQNRPIPYQNNKGFVFGTIYNITYQSHEDLQQAIDSTLKVFDASLSPFNPSSIITHINQNKPVLVDTLFANVFHRSMEISKETEGAFDITIAPLVNAWGFGFKKGEFPDSLMIDSLLEFTDYRKITLSTEHTIIKEDPRIMLTCSAIAKGYAVDIVAELLRKKGIENFMVDIGGEVFVKGVNPKKERWRIGINKPVEDSLGTNQELQTILHIQDVGIATSGNYRNYYYKDGKKYAHTIDPRTGYPVQHSLLSATVIAKDCMSADAYATAFMVMGLEKAEQLANNHPDIEAYFIYTDENNRLQTYHTQGLNAYLQ